MGNHLKAIKQTVGTLAVAALILSVAIIMDAEAETVYSMFFMEVLAFVAWVLYKINLTQIIAEQTK